MKIEIQSYLDNSINAPVRIAENEEGTASKIVRVSSQAIESFVRSVPSNVVTGVVLSAQMLPVQAQENFPCDTGMSSTTAALVGVVAGAVLVCAGMYAVGVYNVLHRMR
ncbi:MAG: hypothetical protein ACI9YB_002608 [Halioglobus sp.]|jgi:hypothetical protein